ncbi:MAG: DoxX family membrane protein [Bacteroidota bacterium]
MAAVFLHAFSYLSSLNEFGKWFIVFILMVFLAVLFLQSGLDKVTDRKGNLDWLTGHFGQSPLKNQVPLLLTVIAVTEILCGVLGLASAVLMLFVDLVGFPLPFLTCALAALNLVMLFFGQRIAKDYPGAAGIVPYFLVALAGMVLTIGYV